MVRRTRGMRRGGRVQGQGIQARRAGKMKQLALLVLSTSMLAACSGDDAASPTTTEPRVETTTAASSTTAPQVATTSMAATTTTETAAPTTTVATVDPEIAVRVAVEVAQETFSACLVAMPACDPATLAVARAGDLLSRNAARIEEWNALGYTVRDRENFRYVIESVELDSAGTAATVTVCIADGSRLVQPNAAPDGGDVIVDDEFVSGRSTWDVRLDADGVWRAFDTAPLGETSSEDVCGAG